MVKSAIVSACALLVGLALASSAAAQSTMVKGRVVDGDGKPVVGAAITIEFKGGVSRKFQTKTDRRGEFLQLLTESGQYAVTVTDPKLGTQSQTVPVKLGQMREVNFALVPGAAGSPEAAKAAELKKIFEEGVTASRAGSHDAAIEKFNAAIAIMPTCHDCYYNIGVGYMGKKDEKQAEEAWKKAIEIKADYAEALNALATLYNNQKRFEEAGAMSARAAAAGGGAGGGSADAVFNQGIILWNQGKIPDAKAKFEEVLKMNPNHPEGNYQMGMALLNEGKLADAVTSFETYLKVAPDGANAATAKAMIAQLKK
jgi:Tfp pilus assembly protein PilF